jgi:hypothetical protein
MIFMELATPGGFEPPISTVTGWHVRPLHHGAARIYITKPSLAKVYQGTLLMSR